MDERLGDPAGKVGSRPVDLGVILTGESTTAVSTPATVSIDNDLAASETGVTLGTTNDELARGLDLKTKSAPVQGGFNGKKIFTYVVNGVLIEIVGRNDLLDNLLKNLLAELFGGDILRVLSRDDDGLDLLGDNSTTIVLILDGDLSLGVGTQPWEGPVAAGRSHGSVQAVSQEESKGEIFGSLVGGIAKHDTLVTSTKLLKGLLVVETLSNIGGLLLNCNEDVASLVVKALGRVIVANVLDGVTDNLLVVENSLGGDFTENHNHTSLGGSLASNLHVPMLAISSCQS